MPNYECLQKEIENVGHNKEIKTDENREHWQVADEFIILFFIHLFYALKIRFWWLQWKVCLSCWCIVCSFTCKYLLLLIIKFHINQHFTCLVGCCCCCRFFDFLFVRCVYEKCNWAIEYAKTHWVLFMILSSIDDAVYISKFGIFYLQIKCVL